jgi:hypothetical protein
MTYSVARTDAEIGKMLNLADAASPTGHPDMTFEQGVAQGIRWALSIAAPPPLTPEPAAPA